MGDFDADDFSTVEGGSETGIHRLPDFKSMLEAALRGDIVSSFTFVVQDAASQHDAAKRAELCCTSPCG